MERKTLTASSILLFKVIIYSSLLAFIDMEVETHVKLAIRSLQGVVQSLLNNYYDLML